MLDPLLSSLCGLGQALWFQTKDIGPSKQPFESLSILCIFCVSEIQATNRLYSVYALELNLFVCSDIRKQTLQIKTTKHIKMTKISVALSFQTSPVRSKYLCNIQLNSIIASH